LTEEHFIVETGGSRLDQFLAEKLDTLSRTRIKQLILEEKITVNNQTVKPGYRLDVSDQISVQIPAETTPIEIIEPEDIPIEIIYEDESIIVINKQAGLVVHPGAGRQTGTLVHALLHHFNQLSDINGPMRPGIIHRLDMETSGVMVIAKTNQAHQYLAKQFENRIVRKKYVGITWGDWTKISGIIDDPIQRKRSDPTSYAISSSGREAKTDYEVIQSYRYLSMVEFYPKTGRTHQIRVHSASKGHPIFGDEKYSGGSSRIKGFLPEISKKIEEMLKKINRHALHAKQLEIIHPETSKSQIFVASLPEDMKTVLEKLETGFV